MRTAIAQKTDRSRTDLILSIEDGNALIQCQVSSAVAAAMLAPLGRQAVGQFRTLPGNLVEIDAVVTLAKASLMIEAHGAASAGAMVH